MCASPVEASVLACAGADFLVAVHSEAFAGHAQRFLLGMMAAGDANTVVARSRRAIAVEAGVPVFSGIFVGDPFVELEDLFERCGADGMVGVQNYPTMGLLREDAPASTYEHRLGFDAEVAAMQTAGTLGLLRMPLAFTPADAAAMSAAGCEVVVAMTSSVGGLSALIAQASGMVEAALAARDDVIALVASARPIDAEDARTLVTSVPGAAGFLCTAPANGEGGTATASIVRSLRER
jgi:predicted TIM-barrel enzyme